MRKLSSQTIPKIILFDLRPCLAGVRAMNFGTTKIWPLKLSSMTFTFILALCLLLVSNVTNVKRRWQQDEKKVFSVDFKCLLHFYGKLLPTVCRFASLIRSHETTEDFQFLHFSWCYAMNCSWFDSILVFFPSLFVLLCSKVSPRRCACKTPRNDAECWWLLNKANFRNGTSKNCWMENPKTSTKCEHNVLWCILKSFICAFIKFDLHKNHIEVYWRNLHRNAWFYVHSNRILQFFFIPTQMASTIMHETFQCQGKRA